MFAAGLSTFLNCVTTNIFVYALNLFVRSLLLHSLHSFSCYFVLFDLFYAF